MKKRLIFALVSFTILLGSCSKSGNSILNSSGNFNIGSTSYTAVAVTNSGSMYSATSIDASYIGFTFYGTATPQAGVYNVTDVPLTADGVMISAAVTSGGSTKIYHSMASTGAKVTVTVSGNAITMTVPAVSCKNLLNGADVVQVSGTLTKN